MKKDEEKRRALPFHILIFLITGAAVFAFSRLTRKGQDATLRNTIVACFGAGVFLFLLCASALRHDADTDNMHHPGRIAALYTVCLIASLALSFVNPYARPFALIYAILLFATDAVCAFYAGSFLLLLGVLCSTAVSVEVFFAYLMTGAVTVAFFAKADAHMKLLWPLLALFSAQTVFLTAFCLLTDQTEIRLSTFTIPIINSGASALCLALLTMYVTGRSERRNEERYLDINDPEFSLLAAIRTKDKQEYYRAIHTAYLADKTATELSLNAQAAKTCALYHRIGCLNDARSRWSDVAHYFSEFEFPDEAVRLLSEYIAAKEEGLQSKETTLVYLCEKIVTHLLQVFSDDKDAHMDYDDMVETIFSAEASSGALSGSELTIRELERARQLLKQEKLYYDFLR